MVEREPDRFVEPLERHHDSKWPRLHRHFRQCSLLLWRSEIEYGPRSLLLSYVEAPYGRRIPTLSASRHSSANSPNKSAPSGTGVGYFVTAATIRNSPRPRRAKNASCFWAIKLRNSGIEGS